MEDGRRIKDVTYFGNAWAGYVALTLEDETGKETVMNVYARLPHQARPTKNSIKVYDEPPKRKVLGEKR